ncbi:MAG: glycosyltransferase family 2 protein [candidate division WOR-3 bacterium]
MLILLSIFGIFAAIFLLIYPAFLPKRKPNSFPFVSIIIPARNEEKNIGELLDTLINQNYKNFEIIVVDDQSKDRTAEIAQQKNAKVIKIQDKPRDFLGKPYACYQGYLNSKGDILLFVDADVRFNKTDVLEKIVAEVLNFNGVVSVWPYHKIKNFYENFSAIYAIISSMASRSFSLISKKITIKGLYGPLIAVKREHYELIGTHKAVKSEIVEDFKLGLMFAERGIPIRNYLGGDDISFRMYPNGLKELWKGWTKNSAIGAATVNWNVVIPILLFLIGSLIPALWISTKPFFLFYLVYAFLINIFCRKVGNFWIIVPILYPVFVAFTLSIIFYSFYSTYILGFVEWKDVKIFTKRN